MQQSIPGRAFSVILRPAESRWAMTDLEKMQKWIQSYPGWKEPLQIDMTEPAPGNAGLFCDGLEERSRQADILGNLQIACRYHFTLYRRVSRDKNDAVWLLDFQNWVQTQSALGLAPRFGDIPYLERMTAQKGTLKDRNQTTVYTVTLTADFARIYEE